MPIYDFLETLMKWVDEIPPIEQPMRFGNKAFKTWIDKLNAVSFTSLMYLELRLNPFDFQKFRRIQASNSRDQSLSA